MTVAPPRETSYLDGLNPAQREAVLYGDGALLVLAGAGSGKTRVLTTRIAHLIRQRGVHPGSVLAVTFTNKAANEMKGRIGRLLGRDPVGMWCGTFHSVGARLVRNYASLVGRTSSFTIYDEDDTLGAIKRIMERLRIAPKERPPQAIAHAMSDAMNRLVSPEAFATSAADPFSRDVAAVYRELEPAMRQANAVTFDHLLTLPVELLTRHDHVLHAIRERFRYILIDEYQDTNSAQYQFAVQVAGPRGNLVVVGDDDQSIYGWRGADVRNILDFEHDFPGAHVVRLEENYRSTPQILAVANCAILANTERRGKTLRTTRAAGDAVVTVACLDERDEADFVMGDIQARRYASRSRPLRDFAILYRTNAQSRAMEESLRRQGMPYRLVGAVRFYDRREIRDLMAYLKLIANPADDEAFRRAVTVPRRGVGDTTIEALATAAFDAKRPLLEMALDPFAVTPFRPAARNALEAFARLILRVRELAKDASVDAVLREVIESVGYLDHLRAEGPEGVERVENVRELVAGAAETVVDEGGEVGLTPLDLFLQRASLVTGLDGLAAGADAVTLMTMHNAKGLEFPVVYVTGVEEGLFPLARSREQLSALEEERRLFYVGITRAEDTLFITHARGRRRNGEFMPSMPSSFLREIPPALLVARSTPRLRSSAPAGDGEASWGRAARPWFDDDFAPAAPTPRRQGSPVRVASVPTIEDESQDAPRYVVGERVQHAKFGGGAIAEVSGHGRDAKVTIDFDDEEVGRKRLVVAHASLTRGMD
ncbi:MAG: UvrD-helicase domain-containing protein [Gemmatimonadaceae bacterium]|nr:UvrD-helicase domain-containing protein [Gemmatimonadaceae bacterium]